MSNLLNLNSHVLAYDDATNTNNPTRRNVDWKRSVSAIVVSNPAQNPYTIEPLTEKTLFDGSRTTSIDASTEFTITLSSLDSNRYRFTNTAGTAPDLRTDRGLDLTGATLTLTVLSNSSLQVDVAAGDFTGAQETDIVYVPGLVTGDSSGPFSELNCGFWVVLSATASQLVLVRPTGDSFEASAEVVAVAAASEFVVYSASGVQVGDNVDISDDFPTAVKKTYEIVEVTPAWFEVVSTLALPLVDGTPDATGMVFYTNAKRYLRIEGDQDYVVRVNGDTGSTQRVTPWEPGDKEQVGEYVKMGPTWSLKVYNRASSVLNLTVITAE